MRASTSEWENLFSAVENFKGEIKPEPDKAQGQEWKKVKNLQIEKWA